MKNFHLFRNQARKFFSEQTSKKLSKYTETLLSPLKKLNTELEHRDVIYVSQQTQRWTAKELDFHSDAFAYYLVEQGLSDDNILFWTDVNHTLEYVSAATGAIKAGNTIISSEFENWEDIQRVLKESKADVLVLSPFVQAEKNKTRLDKLQEAIPELKNMQYGDIFRSKEFPELKQIIQISHKTIPGTEKFKNCLNYSESFMTNLSLPQLKNENVFEIYTEKGMKAINHQDSLLRISEFNNNIKLNYTNILNSAPIFYPINFTLGLFGAFNSKSYNVFPGHYNFVEMLKLIDSQKSEVFIGEDTLLDIQVAKEKLDDVRRITSNVKDVVIFSNTEALNKKDLSAFKNVFDNSKIHFYDEFSFKKI